MTTAIVTTPHSLTDPYAPESSDTAPVRCRFTFPDGRVETIDETVRVLAPAKRPPPALRHRGVLFALRGTAGPDRLYHPLAVVDLGTTVVPRPPLSKLQAEYVAVSRRVAAGNEAKLGTSMGGSSYPAGSTQHADIERRSRIAFALAKAAIEEIVGEPVDGIDGQ